MASDIEQRLARIEAALEGSLKDKAAVKRARITEASTKFVANPSLASAQRFLGEIESAAEAAGDEVAGTPTVSTVTVTTVTTV